MPAPDVIDERFDEIVSALRASRPNAPDGLRERVRSTTAAPARSPRRARPLAGISWRRGGIVLVPAAAATALAVAVAGGLLSAISDDAREQVGGPGAGSTPAPLAESPTDQTTLRSRYMPRPSVPKRAALQRGGASAEAADGAASLPPSRARRQDYQASMRIRVDGVDGLSAATAAAIRTTRGLGGYIVSVDYGTPGGRRGDALLHVRVPIGRVQDAIVRFTGLGTILAQNIQIRDVQGAVDTLAARIAKARRQLGDVNAALREPGLAEDQRARLERRRDGLARRLRGLVRARGATIKQARFATLALALTTPRGEREEEPAPPGRIERALGDAGSILVKEVAWTLYVLIVAAPFAFLLLLAVVGARYATHRADERLLERPST